MGEQPSFLIFRTRISFRRFKTTMQSPMGRGRRSPLNNRRIAGGKESLSREEKTYREIIGPEGKVRPQFQHLMIDLEIDSEDLLDK